jgi:hypothetical protein
VVPGGFELSSQLDLRSKIVSVRVSPAGSSAVVALPHALLLVSISCESLHPHMHVRSVLDRSPELGSVAYCFWYEGGAGEESLEVWRADVSSLHEDSITINRFVIDVSQRINASNDIQLR